MPAQLRITVLPFSLSSSLRYALAALKFECHSLSLSHHPPRHTHLSGDASDRHWRSALNTQVAASNNQLCLSTPVNNIS